MSLSGSESGRSHSERNSRSGRPRQRKLFRKRDKRSRSSERYDFSDLDDDIFVRGPRKLRREDVEGELSYDYTSPGHLKVFTAGLNRCSGLPEFRTVLVSAVATAADVIHEVLQRCDILYGVGDEFFLCEVIGKLEPYQNQQHLLHQQHSRPTGATQFVEQCRRIIGPEEHVLVIQALWKPLYGFYRRFELKQVSRDSGGVNGGPSPRRRRVRLWRTGGADFFRHFDIDDNGGDSENSGGEASVETDQGPTSGRSETKANASAVAQCQAAATQVEPGDPPTQTRGRCRGFGTQTETIYFASADRRLRKKYPVPLGPYLLLLKGFDSRHDLLVNDLFDVNLLGSDDRRCDVHLRCGDVLPEHCVIEACHSEADDIVGGGDGAGVKPYCMSLAPIGGAEVLLNGQQIDRKQVLSPGDVISIGAGEMCSYVFMFKDASQVPDRSVGLAWLMFLESIQRSIEQQQHQHLQNHASAGSFVSTTVPSDSVLETPRDDDDKAAAAASAAAARNRSQDEADAQQLAQASLGSLLALYFGRAIDLQFAAGLLVLMAVYVTDLELEQASAEIQWHLTDSVITLSKKAAQMQDLRDKGQCYAEMIQACALAFEIFLFFHDLCISKNGLTTAAVRCQHWHDFSETTMQQMLDNIFNQLGEEVMSQSAALCDTGLGRQGGPGCPHPSMESFITLLTQVSQAFANAQHPCVGTLRLMVMKRLVFQVAKNFALRVFNGDPAALLKWSCAVQLRVNLDQLEEWLRQESLEQFLTALRLPNSLVDLLATPKSHLVTMFWKVLRHKYPLIPPSLLRHTLSEYESRSGPVAGIWRVSAEDRDEASYDVTCAIEDHFQLAIESCQIPVEEVKPSVKLRQLLGDAEFSKLTLHLDRQTGASNCRLQWSQIVDHIRLRLDRRGGAADNGGKVVEEEHRSSLGDLFSPLATDAASVAASATAANGARLRLSRSPEDPPAGRAGSSDSDDALDDNCLFYDSLSEEGSSGIAAVAGAQNGCAPPGPMLRPKTPTPENPFASLQQHQQQKQRRQPPPLQKQPPQQSIDMSTSAHGIAEYDDDEVSLVDSFTLANTIRNELLGHRVSVGGGGGSEYTEDATETGTVTDDRRGSQLVDSSSEAATTPTATAAADALYWQHTRSLVSMEPPPQQQLLPSSPPLPPQQREKPPPQAPPSPPLRSWSLNSRRCQAVVLAATESSFSSTRSHAVTPSRQRRRGGRRGARGGGDGEAAGDEEEEADLFFVTLTRSVGHSFGMELVDGEKTELSSAGVFIRGLAAGTPAGSCQRLRPGDRIVAVNNQNLANQPYAKCLSLIKQSETVLHLLVSRSHPDVAMLVLATAC